MHNLSSAVSRPLKSISFIFITTISFFTLGMGDHLAFIPSQTSRTLADPELAGEHWFRSLNLGKTWDIATGRGVTIANCAAGYYLDEEELKDNLLSEYRYDLSDQDNPRIVNDGKFVFQGTASASIMVSALNGEGTNGIAFNAKVVPLQNYNYEPHLDDLSKEIATAACVRLAILIEKVSIILIESESRQGSSESFDRTREAVRDAVDAGIVVITSAGDSAKRLFTEESDDTGSIIVGALRQNLSTANFSNYGSRITVSAVGEAVYTMGGPFGEMRRNFGQSPAAAAQVAAAVALALEVNPDLLPRQIRRLLVETRSISSRNAAVGGMINIQKFVLAARQARNCQSCLLTSQALRRNYIQSSPTPDFLKSVNTSDK